MSLCRFMKLLYVQRLPWHQRFTLLSIFIVNARIQTFLGIPAGSVQTMTFITVETFVNTQVVSTCYQHCAWRESCIA